MALASSASAFKAKILKQYGEQELKSRSAILIAEEDWGQLLLKHHLALGSMSTRLSDDHNANLAAQFFEQLSKSP
eukprot:4457756-Amphidinium_carterae.1